MTLDEAIENAEEKAEEIRNEAEHYEIAGVNVYGCEERAKEWEQFAEWLKDYKRLKERESCEDAISRQAALDAMYELCNTGETLIENPWRDNPHIDAITDALDNLQSVTPQPKEGYWIDADGDNAICGCCNRLNHLYGTYCKHCGAKMKESEG